MRLRLISEHAPTVEGTATGRLLRATAEGLLDEGHEVSVICWTTDEPAEELPPWASWEPLSRGHGVADHLAALRRPRWASHALGLTEFDGISFAEEPLSYAAVAGLARSAVVVHYSCLLDAQALGRARPSDLQGHRADLRALRSPVPLTYSQRVADRWGARWIPAAMASAPALDLVDRPRALLLAGWSWGPNLAALRSLQAAWPDVLARVPSAELLVAGRGAPDVPGATVLGEVPTARDAFAAAAVLAFPCPDSTGPKVKVLEAMAAGLPVVTTPAGVEGLAPAVAAAAEVVVPAAFALRLAAVLADPARRADMAARGRAAVLADHSPRVAARARLAALDAVGDV